VETITMIGILFEHPTWLTPLFDALDQRRLAYEKIDVSHFSYEMTPSAVLPLYLNRLSASSYQRHHQQAIACALSYMQWLTAHGARVLNAHNAHLEVNKVDQLLAFIQHGLRIPRTWVFNHVNQLPLLPKDFPFPLLVKPAQGGAGSLILRFDSWEALQEGTGAITAPPDGLMLAQAYVCPAEGYINRVEILGDQLLYALKVYPSDHFNLCPADACEVDVGAPSQAQFFLNETLDSALLDTILRFFVRLKLDYGSIEFLQGDDGHLYFYDLNLNSNYRTTLPGVQHFDPWGQLADYLAAQLPVVS
jgi:hypothetical protein